MIVPPGGSRSDINDQMLEGRHDEERERARQAAIANEARPSWYKQLKAKLRGRSADSD